MKVTNYFFLYLLATEYYSLFLHMQILYYGYISIYQPFKQRKTPFLLHQKMPFYMQLVAEKTREIIIVLPEFSFLKERSF